MKQLSSDYVIKYLDSFVNISDDSEYKIYHVVTPLYEVIIHRFKQIWNSRFTNTNTNMSKNKGFSRNFSWDYFYMINDSDRDDY